MASGGKGVYVAWRAITTIQTCVLMSLCVYSRGGCGRARPCSPTGSPAPRSRTVVVVLLGMDGVGGRLSRDRVCACVPHANRAIRSVGRSIKRPPNHSSPNPIRSISISLPYHLDWTARRTYIPCASAPPPGPPTPAAPPPPPRPRPPFSMPPVPSWLSVVRHVCVLLRVGMWSVDSRSGSMGPHGGAHTPRSIDSH